jgi:hypothetical protein
MSDKPSDRGLDEHERTGIRGPEDVGDRKKRLKRTVSGPLSLFMISGIASEPYLERDLEEGLDGAVEIGDVHTHKEKYSDDLHDDSPAVYSSGGSQGGSRIVVPARVNLAVDYFRPVVNRCGKVSFRFIGKRIDKGMVRELNGVKGIEAEELDKILKDSFCSREQLDRDPEILYRICGQNGILEGCYELDDMFPGDPYDTRNSIRILSRLTYWDSGKYLDTRSYIVSGNVCELDKLFVKLTELIRGDISPPVTHSPKNIHIVAQMAHMKSPFSSRASPHARMLSRLPPVTEQRGVSDLLIACN